VHGISGEHAVVGDVYELECHDQRHARGGARVLSEAGAVSLRTMPDWVSTFEPSAGYRPPVSCGARLAANEAGVLADADHAERRPNVLRASSSATSRWPWSVGWWWVVSVGGV
jgi:hypothetical protein